MRLLPSIVDRKRQAPLSMRQNLWLFTCIDHSVESLTVSYMTCYVLVRCSIIQEIGHFGLLRSCYFSAKQQGADALIRRCLRIDNNEKKLLYPSFPVSLLRLIPRTVTFTERLCPVGQSRAAWRPEKLGVPNHVQHYLQRLFPHEDSNITVQGLCVISLCDDLTVATFLVSVLVG